MWISKKKLEQIKTEAQEDARHKSESRMDCLEAQNAERGKLIADMQTEITRLQKAIRDQSEADMLLSAFRVIMKTANGDDRKSIKTAHSSMMNAQQDFLAEIRKPLSGLAMTSSPYGPLRFGPFFSWP